MPMTNTEARALAQLHSSIWTRGNDNSPPDVPADDAGEDIAPLGRAGGGEAVAGVVIGACIMLVLATLFVVVRDELRADSDRRAGLSSLIECVTR